MINDQLTRVTLHFNAVDFNRYIRFGSPVFREEPTRRIAFEYFKAGQIFCYIQWESGDYGTKYWRLSILKTVYKNQKIYKIKGIDPGAEILLDVTGKERVKKAYGVIDAIDTLDIDPAQISPDYYLYAHQMLNTGLPVRPYSQQQHHAFLKAKNLNNQERTP
ncbi:MAG: DUF2840 domain-containing protein [Opitutaceae bacterium]|nr:DUF2840 domain-containing protein [Opitutaceae bacterium]